MELIKIHLKLLLTSIAINFCLLNISSAQPGDAVEFTSNNSEAIRADWSSPQTYKNWTVSFWVKPNNWNTGTRQTMTSTAEDASGSKPLNFDLGSTQGELEHYRGNAAAKVMGYDVSSFSGWHHVAVTQNRTSGSNVDVKMYVDGEQVASASGDWENMDTEDIAIGASIDNNNPTSEKLHFDGDIDEVKIWGETRTKSEIQKFMHTPIPSPTNKSNLIGYYKMNGNADDDASSSSSPDQGGANNGTLVNSPTFVSSNAVMEDLSKLGEGNTFDTDIKAVWQGNTSATSGGLTIDASGLSLSNGDYVVFGHDNQSGFTSSNVPTGGGAYQNPQRIKQIWKIDDETGGQSVDWTFDIDEASGGYINSNASQGEYMLLNRSSSGTIFNEQANGNGLNTSDNKVDFNSSSLTNDESFTVGTQDYKSSSLPVELTNFKVKKTDEEAIVNWSTASETNNSHFLIQRKNEGEWENLGKVQGHGTTTQPQDYNFTDKHPQKGTNYYRLKQVDFDGSFEYSGVRAVQFEDGARQSEVGLRVLSNPVRHQLRLTVQNDRWQSMDYQLVNSQGEPVRQGQWEAPSGRNTYQITTQNLKPGAYFLKVQTKDQIITRKIIR